MLKFTSAIILGCVLSSGAVAQDCSAPCLTALGAMSEPHCMPLREKLPRPQLYTACIRGFGAGMRTACSAECDGSADQSLYSSQSQRSCEEFKGVRPREIFNGCKQAYMKAAKAAKKEVAELLDPESKAKLAAAKKAKDEEIQQEEARRKLEAEAQAAVELQAAAEAQAAAEIQSIKEAEAAAEANAAAEAQAAAEAKAAEEEKAAAEAEAAAAAALEQARKEAKAAYLAEKENLL